MGTLARCLSLAVVAAGWAALPAAAQQDAEGAPPRRGPGAIVAESAPEQWRRLDPEETLYLELESGRVVIELAPSFAPLHSARLKALARAGFYDGLEFYRVIEGFVAQGGDADEVRDPGALGRTVAAEFERAIVPGEPFTPLGAADGYAPEVGYAAGFPAARDAAAGRTWLVHCPGAVAMARGNEPASGGTEIYVVLGHAPRYLDRNLSIFGRVVAGQELLQKLPRGAGPSGVIEEAAARGKIVALRVAADVAESERSALEVLRTESAAFKELIAARRNRPEEFFIYRPDHIDVCGVPIPVRPVAPAVTEP